MYDPVVSFAVTTIIGTSLKINMFARIGPYGRLVFSCGALVREKGLLCPPAR
jgi:hypothetical protein